MPTKRERRSEPVWQLQEAKARLSEVVRRAVDEGPQHVSLRGEPAVVVLSESDYRTLKKGRSSFVDDLLAGEPWPDDFVDAVNDRSKDFDRDVSF